MSNLVGVTLRNQYVLRELTGSGGMAEVYQAWDNVRAALMAVKVLHRAGSPQIFRQFVHEARIIGHLGHPNIVRVYEFEREGDIAYIVMDWIDGSSLDRVIAGRKQSFDPKEIAGYLQPVCSALYYAHQEGVIHCDVKPANILISTKGQVLLSDFGVARLSDEQAGGGTPAYMAPEQFLGGRVDGRTDVYSLGILVFQLLSGGHVPFRGDTPSSVGSTTRERIAWEHEHLPLPAVQGVNQAVVEVVRTATGKNPDRRYANPLELLEAYNTAAGKQLVNQGDVNTLVEVPDPIELRVANKTPLPSSKSSKRVQGINLIGRAGLLAGMSIAVPPQGLTIGRSRENTLHISEPSISRWHAEISPSRKGCILIDSGSKHGTFVNGKRVTSPTRLRHGDVILIGFGQEFEFRQEG